MKRRFAYDPWGQRRNPENWNEADNLSGLIINRGYTGHEHLDAFGIINMNGRVYDPLTVQFLSPDPYVQAPDNWLNYNRYGYAFGNPFNYTDPSGEFIWIIPNIGWSKIGSISTGVSIVFGIPGGLSAQTGIGYSFGSNDVYGYVGVTAAMNTIYVSYSSTSGGSLGYTVGTSIFSGLPISTNFGTVGFNYNFSHNSYSGNISAWQIDQNGWTFNPSISVAVLPEHTTNFVRGQGFRSNDKVLCNFVENNNHKGALDYWDFEGSYNPNHSGSKNVEIDGEYGKKGAYYGYTDSKGAIFYGDLAFNSFDNLFGTYYKESYSSNQIKSGNGFETCNSCEKDQKLYPEEAKGFKYAARNRGLYSNTKVDQLGQSNSYWLQAYGEPFITNQWVYKTIYKIPRLW